MGSHEEGNSSDTSSEGSLKFNEVVTLGFAVGAYALIRNAPHEHVPRQPQLPTLTGRQWVEKNLRNKNRCCINFRKYYLVEGFALRPGYLGPYRTSRYHRQEFEARPPTSHEEKFNYHNSSLRSVVERAFGALKSKWQILNDVLLYSHDKQTEIIVSCFALHNYVMDRQAAMLPQRMGRFPNAETTTWVLSHQTAGMDEVCEFIATGLLLKM